MDIGYLHNLFALAELYATLRRMKVVHSTLGMEILIDPPSEKPHHDVYVRYKHICRPLKKITATLPDLEVIVCSSQPMTPAEQLSAILLSLLDPVLEEPEEAPPPPKIIRNAIRCKTCGDEIESKTLYDYVECSCRSCAVDGGQEYLRWLCKEKDGFDDLSIVE